jgi:drug/metabolite transporter (DMT)-like permease
MLWLGDSVKGWGILFFLGVAPTLGGFGFYTMSMRFIPATTANLIATLEPVMTAVWAYFFLSELLTGSQLFGGLLILAGVILLRASEK